MRVSPLEVVGVIMPPSLTTIAVNPNPATDSRIDDCVKWVKYPMIAKSITMEAKVSTRVNPPRSRLLRPKRIRTRRRVSGGLCPLRSREYASLLDTGRRNANLMRNPDCNERCMAWMTLLIPPVPALVLLNLTACRFSP